METDDPRQGPWCLHRSPSVVDRDWVFLESYYTPPAIGKRATRPSPASPHFPHSQSNLHFLLCAWTNLGHLWRQYQSQIRQPSKPPNPPTLFPCPHLICTPFPFPHRSDEGRIFKGALAKFAALCIVYWRDVGKVMHLERAWKWIDVFMSHNYWKVTGLSTLYNKSTCLCYVMNSVSLTPKP